MTQPMTPTSITRMDVDSVAAAVYRILEALEHDPTGRALVATRAPAAGWLEVLDHAAVARIHTPTGTVDLHSGARIYLRSILTLGDAYRAAGLELTILAHHADLELEAAEFLEHRLRRSGADAYRGGLTVITIR